MTNPPRPSDVAFIGSKETDCSDKYYEMALKEHDEYLSESKLKHEEEAEKHFRLYIKYLGMMKGCYR